LNQLVAVDTNARDFTFVENVDGDTLEELLEKAKLIFEKTM
jgi:hypothetical protein